MELIILSAMELWFNAVEWWALRSKDMHWKIHINRVSAMLHDNSMLCRIMLSILWKHSKTP